MLSQGNGLVLVFKITSSLNVGWVGSSILTRGVNIGANGCLSCDDLLPSTDPNDPELRENQVFKRDGYIYVYIYVKGFREIHRNICWLDREPISAGWQLSAAGREWKSRWMHTGLKSEAEAVSGACQAGKKIQEEMIVFTLHFACHKSQFNITVITEPTNNYLLG